MSRSHRLLIGALALFFVLPGAAFAEQPPVTVRLEPDGGTFSPTFVERVANGPGRADTWILNAIMRVENNGSAYVRWTRSELRTPSQTIVQQPAWSIAPGDFKRI